jgi:hypothetical protein
MHLVIDEEVKSLAGERHQQHPGRRVQPWGKEDGYCVVDGRKVPIRKTRLRTPDKRERRFGSYELFQHSGPLQKLLSMDTEMLRCLARITLKIFSVNILLGPSSPQCNRPQPRNP